MRPWPDIYPLPRRLPRISIWIERKMADGWEYRKIDLNDPPRQKSDLDLLDKARKEGWELITISANNIAYLKRPIRNSRPKQKK